MIPKTYKCTIGKREIKWTIGLTALLICFAILQFIRFSSDDSFILHIIIGVLFVSISPILYCLNPLKIIISSDKIVVKRLFKNYTIDVDSIVAVRGFEKPELMNSVKRFGSTGFYGYFGYFKSLQYGRYYSFVNNPSNCFLIFSREGSYVLSCDNSNCALIAISVLINQSSEED